MTVETRATGSAHCFVGVPPELSAQGIIILQTTSCLQGLGHVLCFIYLGLATKNDRLKLSAMSFMYS